VLWGVATEADLVVRLAGRVRPVTSPQQVAAALAGEVRSGAEGRVVGGPTARPGDTVRRGQLLAPARPAALDNEITKRRRAIRTGEEELADLDQILRLGEQQHAAARAKVEAELLQAREEVTQAKDRQAAEIRIARLEREGAAERGQALPADGPRHGETRSCTRPSCASREAEVKVLRAELPVSAGRMTVLERGPWNSWSRRTP